MPELPAEQKAKLGTTDKGKTIGEHSSSPFVWLEKSKSNNDKEYVALGGRDMFCKWIEETLPDDKDINELSKSPPPVSEAFFNSFVEGNYKKD